MTESEREKKRKEAKLLAHKYPTYLNGEHFAAEMQHLPLVHKAHFGKPELKPLELLNLLTDYKLCEIFPNVCVSFRILLTIPATVASAERSFSKLKLIKKLFMVYYVSNQTFWISKTLNQALPEKLILRVLLEILQATKPEKLISVNIKLLKKYFI